MRDGLREVDRQLALLLYNNASEEFSLDIPRVLQRLVEAQNLEVLYTSSFFAFINFHHTSFVFVTTSINHDDHDDHSFF